MDRYRYLFKNIGVLTIANLGTKIISFFLIPLYTGVLTTEEYGTYDLINTMICLIVPILTLNLNEAILRFCLEDAHAKNDLVNIAVRYFLVGSIGLMLFVYINNEVKLIEVISDHSVFFILLYISSALLGITTAYARGLDRVNDIAISSMIGMVITIVLNIFFLLVIKTGLSGYLFATILGLGSQGFYIISRTKILKGVDLRKRNGLLEKRMLKYSIPLVVNSIAWWINSASDRWMISYYCSVDENGIYAVAYKIPSLLTMFQTVFNQAWIMSAVKEFDKNDKTHFFSMVYDYYNTVMVISCSILIMLNKVISYILFKNEFYPAWRYAPFLLISVVFGAASGYIGGVYSGTKKTNITAITVTIGALLNVCLNLILINKIGPLGAAIATLLSYFGVWLIRYMAVKKMIALTIPIKRDLLSYALLLIQSILYFMSRSDGILLMSEIVLFILVVLLYGKEISMFIQKGSRFWKLNLRGR